MALISLGSRVPVVYAVLVKGSGFIAAMQCIMVSEVAVSDAPVSGLCRGRAHLLAVEVKGDLFAISCGNLEPFARLFHLWNPQNKTDYILMGPG